MISLLHTPPHPTYIHDETVLISHSRHVALFQTYSLQLWMSCTGPMREAVAVWGTRGRFVSDLILPSTTLIWEYVHFYVSIVYMLRYHYIFSPHILSFRYVTQSFLILSCKLGSFMRVRSAIVFFVQPLWHYLCPCSPPLSFPLPLPTCISYDSDR